MPAVNLNQQLQNRNRLHIGRTLSHFDGVNIARADHKIKAQDNKKRINFSGKKTTKAIDLGYLL